MTKSQLYVVMIDLLLPFNGAFVSMTADLASEEVKQLVFFKGNQNSKSIPLKNASYLAMTVLSFCLISANLLLGSQLFSCANRAQYC